MLSTSIQHQGDGRAELGKSAIQATGPTVVTVDERGTVSAVMQVTSIPTAESQREGAFGVGGSQIGSPFGGYCRPHSPHPTRLSGGVPACDREVGRRKDDRLG